VPGRYNLSVAEAGIPRQEVSVAIETRRELGEELEPQIIEGFLERVGKEIDERVDQRLQKKGSGDRGTIGLAVFSMGFAIPLSGIAAGTSGLAGLLVVWAGIVAVNFAYALRRR
jgi:hypothetical protein